MLPVGAVVAGYRIERVLGTGGMGTVYLAQSPTLPRRDALKVLSAELSRNEEFRARFIHEADIAARLDHPNIVSIYRRGETSDGQLWIAMPYIDGTDADDALRAGTMTAVRAVHIVAEIAKALDYAHQRKIVHRDIKPANFLLSSEGGGAERALLGDFGIARALDEIGHTLTGSLVATVSYAAPEVLSGARLDHRADLYSLGCSLFRLLTGKLPFPADGGMPAMMLAHLQQQPPRPSERALGLPPELDSVIATAMAKDPAQRFQTAAQLAAAATAALHGNTAQHTAPWQVVPSAEVSSYPSAAGTTPWWQPAGGPRTQVAAASPHTAQITRPPRPPYQPPPRRRPRWIFAALAAILVTVAGGITATTVMTRSSDHAATPTATPSPPASPVPMSALNSLLLSIDEIDSILGTKVSPAPVQTGTSNDADSLSNKDCAGPFSPVQQIVYQGSGWQAVAVQLLREPPAEQPTNAPPILARQAIQAVVSFPAADLAAAFLDKQRQQWPRCNNTNVTVTVNNTPLLVSLGTFATTSDGILTTTWTPQEGQGWTCARALTVRNNIAVDTEACNYTSPMDPAIDIVHKIAAQIRL